MDKDIDSIKHRTDTRAHIPSKEEAGYEDASEIIKLGFRNVV